MSDRTLCVYFDYISPFAYIASEILPPLAARHDLTLDWRPLELLALSNFEKGLPYSPSKRAYVGVDAARAADFHGVTLRLPKPFPVRSRSALTLATIARSHAGFADLHRALFRAAWCEQRDLSSESVLAECATAAGLPAREYLADSHSADAERGLAAARDEAEAAGVFGVPTAVLDGELFWGIDSFPALEWRLRQGGR